MMALLAAIVLALVVPLPAWAEDLPLFDAHVHYSHDAWDVVPPKDAVALLRKAGVKGVLLSSSDDDGTQKLLAEAPDLIIPELRPYRRRSDVGTWASDASVVTYLEERLAKYRYVAIGEFHLYGDDALLPVPRRLVQLAKKHGLMLHAHADVPAIELLFREDPEARILWAHSGFEPPAKVREMLAKHKNLWADLAFRTDHGAGGKVAAEWRPVLLEFPDRFMLGTDTFVPERWYFVPEQAAWSRAWLADLPADVADRIAWKNGEAVLGGALARRP